MIKSFKYELNPTDDQKKHLYNSMGACRFIYNLALETKTSCYKSGSTITTFDLINQIPELKKDLYWLKSVPSQSLQQSIIDLGFAFENFFRKKSNYPKFKKKSNRQSFRIPISVNIDFTKKIIKLPKYGDINFYPSRVFFGKIKFVTISMTPTNRYFISITVDSDSDLKIKKPVLKETAIGIDLGVTNFATISNGIKINNPRFLIKNEKKLRIAKRSLSRKSKGSKSRERQRVVVSKIYEKIVNQRNDFLHKLSTEIINQYDSICVEDLNILGMVKNHKISKHILSASWANFLFMLKYKAEWEGKNIIQIGRYEPSSKLCDCGEINNELKLSDREWTCKNCNSTHDRDILASNNIKKIGLGMRPITRQREVLACA